MHENMEGPPRKNRVVGCPWSPNYMFVYGDVHCAESTRGQGQGQGRRVLGDEIADFLITGRTRLFVILGVGLHVSFGPGARPMMP